MQAAVLLVHGLGVRDADWGGAIARRLAARILEEAAVIPSQRPPTRVSISCVVVVKPFGPNH